METNSIVILGGGQAGAWAAKTLRDEGHTGRVTLVCEERHAPYERPALSKDVLAGKAAPHTTRVFGEKVFDDLKLDYREGVRAESLDRRSKRVHLSDNTDVSYDKVVFCTGGRALRPPIEGVELPGVYTLRTLEDCQRLRNALLQAENVCVVGGGWIGMEVASTAIHMDKPVTLLEREHRLCARVLPADVSTNLLRLHQHAGVDVRLEANVTAIQAEGARLRVATSNGTSVFASIVVIGAGLVANDEIASNAGLPCSHGIIVDNHCVTADPDILAAGDVAVAPNRWAGRAIRLESWENAREQAIVAAKVSLGANAHYEPLPWFWSDQHDVNLQIYGWPQPHHRTITRYLGPPNSQITFLLDAGKIVSAVAINAARELRMSRKLIERSTTVLESALSNPDIKLSSI